MAKQPTTKRLNVRIDDELYARLERLRQRGYNVSAIAIKSLNAVLDEMEVPHTDQYTDYAKDHYKR